MEIKSAYGVNSQAILNKLKPDLIKIAGKNFNIKKMRKELNTYNLSLPNDKKYIVHDVVQVLKKIHAEDQDRFNPDRDHILTDHAFVRGLSRIYGVNICKVKDRMVEAINESGLDYIKHRGKIVTILPNKRNCVKNGELV